MASSQPTPPNPPKGPRDYRPDLRPIIVLGIVLLAVVVAWVLLSPLILPR